MVIKTKGSQKETQVIEMNSVYRKLKPALHYSTDYDTTKPEETLQTFVSNIKDMMARYTGNKARIIEIEKELSDLEHYMEISSYKTIPNGYKLYRKLAELRKERRKCKNENDLLVPIYEHFHATEVLNKLSLVQGECGKLKETIDGRLYQIQTDVLDEYIYPEGKNKTEKKENEPEDKTLALVPSGLLNTVNDILTGAMQL